MILKLKVEQPLSVKVGAQCLTCLEWDVIPYPIYGKLVRLILSRLPVTKVEIEFPGSYSCFECGVK